MHTQIYIYMDMNVYAFIGTYIYTCVSQWAAVWCSVVPVCFSVVPCVMATLPNVNIYLYTCISQCVAMWHKVLLRALVHIYTHRCVYARTEEQIAYIHIDVHMHVQKNKSIFTCLYI